MKAFIIAIAYSGMYNLAFMYNIPIIHPLDFFIVQKVAIVYGF